MRIIMDSKIVSYLVILVSIYFRVELLKTEVDSILYNYEKVELTWWYSGKIVTFCGGGFFFFFCKMIIGINW